MITLIVVKHYQSRAPGPNDRQGCPHAAGVSVVRRHPVNPGMEGQGTAADERETGEQKELNAKEYQFSR